MLFLFFLVISSHKERLIRWESRLLCFEKKIVGLPKQYSCTRVHSLITKGDVPVYYRDVPLYLLETKIIVMSCWYFILLSSYLTFFSSSVFESFNLKFWQRISARTVTSHFNRSKSYRHPHIMNIKLQSFQIVFFLFQYRQ